MKNLVEFVNEGYITEAMAKDINKPRKGSSVYVLKVGETKAVLVKIVDVNSVLIDKSAGKSYVHYFTFDNPAFDDLEGYEMYDFATIGKEPKAVTTSTDGKYIIGISKEAIKEYVDSISKTKLASLNKQITDLQKELNSKLKEKDKLEAQINAEITESLS